MRFVSGFSQTALIGLLSLLLLVALVGSAAAAPSRQVQSRSTEVASGPPPEPGAVVVEDPLTAPGVIGLPGSCPTGLNRRDFVGEGTIFKVTGRCVEGNTGAGIAARSDAVNVADGEIRLEIKAVSGQERAQFSLYARGREGSLFDGYYSVVVIPARGVAQLRLRRSADGDSTILAERTDLASLMSGNDWNNLALRLRGSDLWILLNDQLILSARDATFDSGVMGFGLTRLGAVDDTQEAAVVLRNLRVSALTGSDQARWPTYLPRPTVAPAPTSPPWIGDLAFGYEQSEKGAPPAGATLPDRSVGTIYSFFSWRNVPGGTKIHVQVLWGNDVRGEFDFAPPQPNGRSWVRIINFDSTGGGGATWPWSTVGVAYSVNGQELARGVAGLP